uniref:Uncharacterized protein n=2 Tax=Oryza glumipatula TaxID=40148 RepID=A0A0D9YRY6_9ORYZ
MNRRLANENETTRRSLSLFSSSPVRCGGRRRARAHGGGGARRRYLLPVRLGGKVSRMDGGGKRGARAPMALTKLVRRRNCWSARMGSWVPGCRSWTMKSAVPCCCEWMKKLSQMSTGMFPCGFAYNYIDFSKGCFRCM